MAIYNKSLSKFLTNRNVKKIKDNLESQEFHNQFYQHLTSTRNTGQNLL
jgi:uncharacterized protein YcgL (UPF0745 family)